MQFNHELKYNAFLFRRMCQRKQTQAIQVFDFLGKYFRFFFLLFSFMEFELTQYVDIVYKENISNGFLFSI